MKKSGLGTIIAVIALLFAVAAAAGALYLRIAEKREEEELEYYLDGSIQ